VDEEQTVRRTMSILMVTAAVAMGPMAGSAGAAATTSTSRWSETEVEDGLYCHGEEALATWVYDVVEHVTVRPDGRESVTANIRAVVTWSQHGEDFEARATVNYRFTEGWSKYIAKGTGTGSLGTRVRFDEVIQARRTADGYDIKQYRDDVYCTTPAGG
jgi:hypothetical protein